MIKILFVCLGNICRSPMAEVIFKDLVKKEGLESNFIIDSAGTSNEEVGNSMYYHARRKLDEAGIKYENHIARPGRTFEIDIYPFSFKEFLTYYEYKDLDEAFDKYVLEGGLSGSYLYKTSEDKYNYIYEVYNTLIVRDIISKYKIRYTELLDNLSDFLMDNISNITTLRNISKEFEKNGTEINHKTIGAYIKYLCNSFLFYKVRRYDIQGKKYLSMQDKYYLVDQGFKYAALGTKNINYGRIYENIVAIELLRRGYEIYVGMLYGKEIDFVAMKRDEKIYIQVSDDISGEDTFNREVNSLLKIKDAYPKMIIARTKHDTYQYEGIEVVDIAKWLLG